jgi:hypothetical protein
MPFGGVVKECAQCGRAFKLNDPRRRFCSRACFGASRRGVPRSPETRRKIGEANEGRTRSLETRRKMSEAGKGKTLSLEHRRKLSEAAAGRAGPAASAWKGGRRIDARGYIQLTLRGHPMADPKGRVPEHRLVVAERIGRWLLPTERVHHANGVKTDNRPENLWLFADTSSHQAWHKMLVHGGELRVHMPAIPVASRVANHRARGLDADSPPRFDGSRAERDEPTRPTADITEEDRFGTPGAAAVGRRAPGAPEKGGVP